MIGNNIYLDLKATLLVQCKNLVTNNPSLLQDFQVFDFDSHASQETWPTGKHLIGTVELSVENLKDMYVISGSFMVAQKEDTQDIERLDAVINLLFDSFAPGGSIDVIRKSDGSDRGQLVFMDGLKVLPVVRAKARPCQMVMFEAGTSFPPFPM